VSYDIVIWCSKKDGREYPQEGWNVATIEEARRDAQRFVQDRMDAFGEDREALERYGYTRAMDRATDMPEKGDIIMTQDGWKFSAWPSEVQ
jgi:uncharacterized protein YbdZ (MbtH family)